MKEHLDHIAGSKVEQSAGELARARRDVGERTRLGRRAGERVSDRYAVPTQV
jgi:hypothetical protein